MKTDMQIDAEMDQTIEMARRFVAGYPEEAIDGLQDALEDVSDSDNPAAQLAACLTNLGLAVVMQAQKRYAKSIEHN